MKWIVKVSVKLLRTADDAEIDPFNVGDHRIAVYAMTEEQAIERALDQFHETVPIGVLEYVDIETAARACMPDIGYVLSAEEEHVRRQEGKG